jgi:hypothetical protein
MSKQEPHERRRPRTPNNRTTTGFRISDDLWAVLEPLLPEHVNRHRFGGGRPRVLDRTCADPYMGLKLFATFTAAGLPPPALSTQASVAAGPDHPVYAAFADFMRTLLPRIVAHGVATADEVAIDSLASRINAEAVATGATVIWMSVIGAASRTSAE